MKKIVYILCAAAALASGLWGCQKKTEEAVKTVDLRYRANDSYDLPATGARAFTILVVSSDPWTVSSEHPDWCIISEEQGEASDPSLIHLGQATPTTISIQYYDNIDLDDRVDKITIQSDYWVGKVITVNQKGCAFLTVPDADMDLSVEKAGGDYTVHIASNQKWSSKVTDGEWLSIKTGETGEGDGNVVVEAGTNDQEIRYGEVTVYDRHAVAVAKISFTQDGVQLVPLSQELRAAYNQTSAEVEVKSNTRWKAYKLSAGDDWFEISESTREGVGDGKIQITITPNDDTSLREAEIILETANPDDYHVERTIVLKQAYHMLPVVYTFDNAELEKWNSQGTVLPVYTSGSGMLFANGSKIQNGSMPFGDYTFYWKDIVATGASTRIRITFAYADLEEMKFGLRNSSGKNVMYLDFNESSTKKSTKPTVGSLPETDFSAPHSVSCRFTSIPGTEYCQVSFYLDDEPAMEFTSSDKVMDEVKWGTKINMYIQVDSGNTTDAVVLEKYEYTAPFNWDD